MQVCSVRIVHCHQCNMFAALANVGQCHAFKESAGCERSSHMQVFAVTFNICQSCSRTWLHHFTKLSNQGMGTHILIDKRLSSWALIYLFFILIHYLLSAISTKSSRNQILDCSVTWSGQVFLSSFIHARIAVQREQQSCMHALNLIPTSCQPITGQGSPGNFGYGSLLMSLLA